MLPVQNQLCEVPLCANAAWFLGAHHSRLMGGAYRQQEGQCIMDVEIFLPIW